jgi:hypothetical protein
MESALKHLEETKKRRVEEPSAKILALREALARAEASIAKHGKRHRKDLGL